MKTHSDIKPKNHTIAHVFVMVLMLGLGILFIFNTVYAAKDYYVKIHANFVKEYATIVRYEAIFAQNGRRTYSTFYEYEADGGVYYGCWQRLIKDEEEAKGKVGKKAVIYVDHDLKIHTTSLDFSPSAIWFAGIIATACWLVFLNSFIRETVYIVRWNKYKKAQKSQND